MKKRVSLIMTLLLVVSFANTVFAEETSIKEEVIYQILIDRFNNGDFENDQQVDVEDPMAYHGGDLEGIVSMLDDLVEIGITTISLNPLMENAEDGYHGYFVEDYFAFEHQFGTLEDLKTLIKEAHDRGVKVVMEFPINYVSETHAFAETPGMTTNIQAPENAPVWMEEAVKLNQENEEVTQHLLDAAAFWQEETDLDGFTIHAADRANIPFVTTLTEQLKETEESFYLIGDVLFTDEQNERLLEETGLDIVDSSALQEVISETFAAPDRPVEPIYETWENMENKAPVISVDDFYMERFTQTFSEQQRNSLTAWTLALTYMYTTPGAPAILQGSELPMYGRDAEESQRLVPFNSGDSEVKEFQSRISALREQFPALQHGDFEWIGSKDSMGLYKRSYEGETLFVAINNGSESAYIDIEATEDGKQLRGFLNDNLVRVNEEGNYRIGLPRESAEVYVIQEDTGLNWLLIGFMGGVLLVFVVSVIFLMRKQKKAEKASQS